MRSVQVSDKNNRSTAYREIVREYLNPDEIRSLQHRSDWKGLRSLVSVWLWIIASFALVAIYPAVWTFILAAIVIGSRQLGCAIIMHDASHFSLFRTRRMNIIMGNLFGAYPIFQNVEQYRPYHLRHHIATGTEEDPDINLTKGYPASGKGMFRKFARDLSGLSGLRGYFGILLMHLGFLEYNLGNYVRRLGEGERKGIWKNVGSNLLGPVMFQILLFIPFLLMGKPLLYLLWPLSLLTTNFFFLRVRALAEHSMSDSPDDPIRNTRTVEAGPVERWFFAPLNVNYHLEHHLMFTVPSYNLKRMHDLLKERGFYIKANRSESYRALISQASRSRL